LVIIAKKVEFVTSPHSYWFLDILDHSYQIKLYNIQTLFVKMGSEAVRSWSFIQIKL
jgi:hypothetical protein